MTEAPDAVLLYIPLMKNLGMSWEEIKSLPRWELEGLMQAYSEHEILHSMDGYDENDISEMAKGNPKVRTNWRRYKEKQAKYESMVGLKRTPVTFKNLGV